MNPNFVRAPVQEQLAQLHKNKPPILFELMYTVNLDGRTMAMTQEGLDLDVSHRPGSKGLPREKVQTDIYISTATYRPCVTLALPLRFQGEIVGVLGADVKL